MTFPTPQTTPDVEQSVKRIQDLSNQAIEASKQSGQTWLDAYEKMIDSFLKMQQQAAQGSQADWINTVADTNADFVRQLSQLYLTAARDQLK